MLATDGWLPFKQKHFSHDQALLAEATELNQQHDSGLISHEGFYNEIAGMSGVPVTAVKEQLRANAPNEPLFDYIAAELRPGYKIGVLSNASGNYMAQIFTPEQVKLFDAVALSYELGMTKPEPGMYDAIAGRLGVEARECVFIDDQERHCTGAREAGMQAILYKDFEQFKVALEKFLA